jgi:lipid A 4'-phosphatase
MSTPYDPATGAAVAVPATRPSLPGLPRWLLALLAALSLALWHWPQIDLAVSGLFADAAGFPLQHHPWLDFANAAVLQGSRVLIALLLVTAVLAWLAPGPGWLKRGRRVLLFLVMAAALGPGLLVNLVLKEGSGRARPVVVAAFGGTQAFTPAFVLARECADNCSFVSGHVSIAAMPMAGWFIARGRRRRRAWLVGGLAFALLVGLVRIAVGAHFFSDVLLAIAFTWVISALCAAVILRQADARRSH